MSVFRDAITGDDNRVDAGYLAMYWSLIGWSVSSICILAMGIASLLFAKATEYAPIIQSTGIALGAVAGTFATVVGAVGLFRAGDKPHATTQTTTIAQTTTVPTAPAAAAADAAPVAYHG